LEEGPTQLDGAGGKGIWKNSLTLMGVVHYGYEMSNMLLKNKKRKKGGK